MRHSLKTPLRDIFDAIVSRLQSSPGSVWITIVAIGAFILAKSAVFIAPLILVQSIGTLEYGQFEYALSWAGLISVVCALGLPSSLPYFLIEKKRTSFHSIVPLYEVVLASIALVAAVLLRFVFGLDLLSLIVTLSAMLAIQRVRSTIFLIGRQAALSSIIDSGIYILIIATLAVFFMLGRSPSITQIFFVLLASTAIVLIGGTVEARGINSQRVTRRLVHTAFRGVPLMAASFLTIAFATCGRLIIGSILGDDNVATYSICVRVASTAIIFHALLNALFFRDLYEASARSIDVFWVVVLIAVLAVSAASLFIAPNISVHGYDTIREVLRHHPDVCRAIMCQTVLWVASAQIEPIIYRHGLQSRLITILLVSLGVIVSLSLILNAFNCLSLIVFCKIQVGVSLGFVIWQLQMLRKQKFKIHIVQGFLCLMVASYTVIELAGW